MLLPSCQELEQSIAEALERLNSPFTPGRITLAQILLQMRTHSEAFKGECRKSYHRIYQLKRRACQGENASSPRRRQISQLSSSLLQNRRVGLLGSHQHQRTMALATAKNQNVLSCKWRYTHFSQHTWHLLFTSWIYVSYCQCFAGRRLCDGCNCNNCLNTASTTSEREEALRMLLET
jgi:hypothetical protein